MTVMSSRQFNQDTGKAKKAADPSCARPPRAALMRMSCADARQGGLLRQWLYGTVLPFFAGRVLPVDLPVALRCAEMPVPDRKLERGGFIGAPAHAHNMALITRTVRDFEGMDIRILDPWLDV